jgi:hypothetical protein
MLTVQRRLAGWLYCCHGQCAETKGSSDHLPTRRSLRDIADPGKADYVIGDFVSEAVHESLASAML